MRVTIETDRLIIRNLKPGDEKEIYAWTGDPDVAKYMIYPMYNSEADGIEWLKSREMKADDPDDYDLGFALKETGELIGGGGLVYQPDDDVWVVGYNLRKDAWGNGYVVEALSAIMDEIRKTRKIRAIEGVFAVDNYKSQRVMEKLGMTFVEDTEYEKLDGSAHFIAKKYRRVWDENPNLNLGEVYPKRAAENNLNMAPVYAGPTPMPTPDPRVMQQMNQTMMVYAGPEEMSGNKVRPYNGFITLQDCPGGKMCSVCGCPNQARAKFCINCGNLLED